MDVEPVLQPGGGLTATLGLVTVTVDADGRTTVRVPQGTEVTVVGGG